MKEMFKQIVIIIAFIAFLGFPILIGLLYGLSKKELEILSFMWTVFGFSVVCLWHSYFWK